MNKKEQDFIRKLKGKTDDIKIPDSVKPEQVEKLLKEKQKKKISPFRIGALAAACLVLVAGIAVYKNSTIGGQPGIANIEEKKVEISEGKTVVSAADYDEVYGYIERYKEEQEEKMRSYEEGTAKSSAMDDAGTMEIAQEARSTEAEALMAENDSGATAAAGGYSETNVRQEGVDEGDVVKTDGTYLYILKDNRKEVSFVDIRGDKMKEVQKISVEEEQWIEEMYLNPEKKRLVLVCSRYGENSAVPLLRQVYSNAGATEAVTYDVTNPEKPKEMGRIKQSGYYQSSRMADGYLYLFSNYSVAWDLMEKGTPNTYIPLINDSTISEKNICLPQTGTGREYTVAVAVDIDKPGEVTDSKAILSQGGQLYVSNKNIYYYETIWSSYLGYNKERTTIRRIGYKDGELTPGSQGIVEGYINDSFSIDEYDGYLRIVTTQGDSNGVYVLDMDLEEVGKIEKLAKDERVYSARLMGEIGYFVTFRETDPLFSVDLSDPENPEVIGSLKIPGFSDYLHPYGDGRLLGIGMNVDEETMITDGVKLTMFDISDPTDVKEEDTYILENVYSTDVSYNYKAALVDVGRNIIGFAGYTNGGQNYYIFEYDENKGFICNMEEEINGNASLSARGVYIDDTLYVVQGNIVEAYSLKEYVKVDDIIL
ncbi:beta-propeller domain-containing protein [Lachnospiraceae bacterium 42-17]